MSEEDDSMNEVESEEHEEEEIDDSSSESVDEEIKLNQNFITTLQKISVEGKNYDDFILLVSASLIFTSLFNKLTLLSVFLFHSWILHSE